MLFSLWENIVFIIETVYNSVHYLVSQKGDTILKDSMSIFINDVRVQFTSQLPIDYRKPLKNEILISSYCESFEAVIDSETKLFTSMYVVKNSSDEIKILFVK